jgi:signal transduction histidine kinase/FixJ family two-component response regulator
MNEKILLVDDEEGIRKVLGISLADSGYRVLAAESGETALQIFKEHNPSIVLTDIRMPGIDGVELLRRIKAQSPDTEVIMISGHGDMDLAIQSLKYEASDFIVKPISDDALEIALKRVHEKISMRQQLRDYTENLEKLVREKSEKLIETERLAAQQYQRLAQRYQQLFDEVPCYVSVHDRDFRLTAANRRFQEDFGDHLGSHCYAVYKHRDAPCPNCPVILTFEDGQPHYSEAVVASKSGEQYNVLIWTAPIYNEVGEITQVMEMSTNVTQVRKLQSHLSSLGLLIGSISHGIKGLLTGLDGGMYLLNSGLAKNNRQQIKEGSETVGLIVGRIRKMVLDILYYARERELKWEKVAVLTFAEEVAAIVESKMVSQGIEFVRDFDRSLGTIELDASVVHSALINILENAIEACVEDKSKPSHAIVFGARQDEGAILFDVQDNGTGMDKETQERLFTLFFSSKGQKGTGLGLFIANQIIRQHGGSIRVESKRGEGSVFRIRIPRMLSSEKFPPQTGDKISSSNLPPRVE